MYVVAAILGLLLLVFGGGCVIIMVGGTLFAGSGSLLANSQLFLLALPLGVLPAGLGWLLLRYGMRKAAEKHPPPEP